MWHPANYPLQWCHNEDDVSNHQPRDCLLNCLFKHISKKTSKLYVTGLCVGNSPVNGEFSAQRASNAENVSIGVSGSPTMTHTAIQHDRFRCVICFTPYMNTVTDIRQYQWVTKWWSVVLLNTIHALKIIPLPLDILLQIYTPIARFMGLTWGPSGTNRTQVGPILATWTLLSGIFTVSMTVQLES